MTIEHLIFIYRFVFTARALLIDSRHFMTFDQRFVGLNLNVEQFSQGQCSYLLAHDFFKRNFTLLLDSTVGVTSHSHDQPQA